MTASPLASLSARERFDVLRAQPLERIKQLLPSQYSVNDRRRHLAIQEFCDLCMSLAALEVLSRTLSSLVRFDGYVYILDDESVVNALILSEMRAAQNADSIVMADEILAVCGLVYRFNCALKFGYSDRSVYQLRLNSWGRKLIHDEKLAARPPYRTLESRLREYVLDHRSVYEEIIPICLQPEGQIDHGRLHQLNDEVLIKVVT